MHNPSRSSPSPAFLDRAEEVAGSMEASVHKIDYLWEMDDIVVDVKACEDMVLHSGILEYGDCDRLSSPKAKTEELREAVL